MTSGHEIISARRKEIDWSQAKLSKALGIGLTTFQRYERGERPIPLPVARKIAEILDVSLAEIAGQLQAAEPTATPLSVAGDAILARRKQLGLTAARAAATVGFPLEQYQQIESGEKEPTLTDAIALSEALDMPLDEMAGIVPKAVDFNGPWWAIWQGGIHQADHVDLHTVSMLRAGDKLLLDAGWRGELQVFGNEVLVGWYRPPAGFSRTRQGVFLWLPTGSEVIYGKWTAVNTNNSVTDGWCALARDETKAREVLDLLVNENTQPRPPLKLPRLGSWGT